MFEEVELGNTVSKGDYKEQAPPLRLELLKHQFELRDADFPVIVVLAGDDRAGRDKLVLLLNEWLDSRFIEINAMGAPFEEERSRPEFWRYWRRLPAAGRIGVFLGGWTTFGILGRIRDEMDDRQLDLWSNHVREFESTLVEDGAVLVKFWTHAPKDVLRERLERAEECPEELWNIGEADREIFNNYDEGCRIAERVLRDTSTGKAPWHIVESTDWRACNLSVARTLLRAISKRLTRPERGPESQTISLAIGGSEASKTVLDRVDLSKSLDKDDYEKKLKKEQAAIRQLTEEAARKKIPSVLVFEGWDAAGKGGAVRRLSAAVAPAHLHVVSIAAPTDEERAHHYLWRFWRKLPRAGKVTVFDRSWYGRVLVERVEGFARREDWRRAYHEIVDFEEQLWQYGCIVQKFWIHVDADEQLRRFKEREKSPLKQWKITDEDWRNRDRWQDYERAINEMVQRTSTVEAPWIVIPGNDKRWARVQVLKTYRKRLEEAVG